MMMMIGEHSGVSDAMDVDVEEAEQWRAVPGYSKYSVSSLGRFRGSRWGNILAGSKDGDGYVRVGVTADSGQKKTPTLHRLIALAFIPNPLSKPTVNHKNRIRDDNRVENLEWATMAEQNKNRYMPPKSSRPIWMINAQKERVTRYESPAEAAEAVGVTRDVIYQAIAGKSAAKRDFCWEYEEIEAIIEGELWKDIQPDLLDGQTGYQIQSKGRLRDTNTSMIREPKPGKGVGYCRYGIAGKVYMAHILTARSFLPPDETKIYVNHLNGNKGDCNLSNLELTTPAENQQHAVRTGLSKSVAVVQFDQNGVKLAQYPQMTEAQKVTGFSVPAIHNCVNGHCRMVKGFVFKTLEEVNLSGSNTHPPRAAKQGGKANKPVVQFDISGREVARFSQISEAAQVTGFNSISECLRKQQHMQGGFWFKTLEEVESSGNILHPLPIKPRKGGKPKKAVEKWQLERVKLKTYSSLSEASADSGISPGGIAKCATGIQETAGNYKWKFVNM